MVALRVDELNDVDLDRLRFRASIKKVSVDALAREAIRQAGNLTPEEKLALVREMQAESLQLQVPGVEQTPGWILIREGRDEH